MTIDHDSDPPRSSRGEKSAVLTPDPPIILLAEDDSDMRQLIGSMLRRDGYVVLEARDGAGLLKLIQATVYSTQIQFVPELIISDIRMPRMTGLEVLSWLRNVDWMTPFILLTGFGDRATHQKAENLGVAAIFDKPFEFAALRQRVADIVPIP
jgi:CheY-like chemotaxis protein